MQMMQAIKVDHAAADNMRAFEGKAWLQMRDWSRAAVAQLHAT